MERIWDIDELVEYWSLKFEETQLLKTKIGEGSSSVCCTA